MTQTQDIDNIDLISRIASSLHDEVYTPRHESVDNEEKYVSVHPKHDQGIPSCYTLSTTEKQRTNLMDDWVCFTGDVVDNLISFTDLKGAFANGLERNNLVCLFNSMPRSSYHMEYTDEEYYDLPEYELFSAIEFSDPERADQLILLSSTTLRADDPISLDSVKITVYTDLTPEQKRDKIDRWAASALSTALFTNDLGYINDVVCDLRTYRCDVGTIFSLASGYAPSALLALSSACAQTCSQPPVLPDYFDYVKWSIQSKDEGIITYKLTNKEAVTLSFSTLLEQSGTRIPDVALFQKSTLKKCYFYARSIATHKGVFTGEIRQQNILPAPNIENGVENKLTP